MVDPLSATSSALALAKLLFGASKSLYQFCQQTKDIDQNIASLRGQVDGIAQIAQNVVATIDQLDKKNLASANDPLWTYVHQTIEACRKTSLRFTNKLKLIEGQSDSFIRNAWRQFKMSLIQGDLSDLMSSLKTHSVNLQLALACINVAVSAAIPNIIISDQSIRFERLERMLVVLDQRLGGLASTTSSPDLEYLKTVVLDENTEKLRKIASSVISSASTCTEYISSDATNKPALALNEPAFKQFHHIDIRERVAESTTGSELGNPNDPQMLANIHKWFSYSSTLEALEEYSSSGALSPSSPSLTTDVQLSSNSDIVESHPDLFDPDSEDDLDSYVSHGLNKRAKKKYDEKDYISAEKLITMLFREACHLSLDQQRSLDLSNMRLMRGHCLYEQGYFRKAEADFLEVVEEPIRDASDLTRVFSAYEGLAIYNLRRRNYEAARNHCRQAVRGRGKMSSVGKTHPDYIRALRVLALIEWARGEPYVAQVLAERLPKSQTVLDFDKTLNEEYPLLGIDDSKTPEEKGREQAHFEKQDGSKAQSNVTEESGSVFDISMSKPKKSEIDHQTSEQSGPELNSEPEQTLGGQEDTAQKVTTMADVSSECQSDVHAATVNPNMKREALPQTPLPGIEKSLDGKHILEKTTLGMSTELIITSTPDQLADAQRRCSTRAKLRADKGLAYALSTCDTHLVNWILTSYEIDLARLRVKFKFESSSETYQGNLLHIAVLRQETSKSRANVAILLKNYKRQKLDIDARCYREASVGRLFWYSPLQISIDNRKLEFCKMLIGAGANIQASGGEALLNFAARKQNIRACQLLLDCGANVEGNVVLQLLLSFNNNTSLIDAIYPPKETKQFLEFPGQIRYLCDTLFKCGANVDATDYAGSTALMHAAGGWSAALCVYLISKGADTDVQNRDGETALMFAVRSQNVKFVQCLVSQGAKTEIRDELGRLAIGFIPKNSDVRREILDALSNGNQESNTRVWDDNLARLRQSH